DPAGAEPAAAVARGPALHERLRADLGRGVGGQRARYGGCGAHGVAVRRGFRPTPRHRLPVPGPPDPRFPDPHTRLPDMNRKGDKALIVGLDIGTSKVVALVGEYSPGNPIEVIGIG